MLIHRKRAKKVEIALISRGKDDSIFKRNHYLKSFFCGRSSDPAMKYSCVLGSSWGSMETKKIQ